MKAVTIIISLLLAFTAGFAAESSPETNWFKEGLSADERNALVERLKNEPFDKIAPVILKALVDHQPAYGINPSGHTPWNDDRLTPRDRTYLMASAVWQHHMSPRDDLPRAKVVLSLLQRAPQPAEKTILIGAIRNHQWCPDAEKLLLEIANNKDEDLGVRTSSVTTLLSRCNVNAYIRLAVEVVLAHKKGSPCCQAFHFTMNQGNRLFTLNERNRRLVLATGFEILTELPGAELQSGYFVARHLGFMLKRENDFAPDQKAKKYQGEHGLKDEFFIDTVKNAIEWYSENKKEIQSN